MLYREASNLESENAFEEMAHKLAGESLGMLPVGGMNSKMSHREFICTEPDNKLRLMVASKSRAALPSVHNGSAESLHS